MVLGNGLRSRLYDDHDGEVTNIIHLIQINCLLLVQLGITWPHVPSGIQELSILLHRRIPGDLDIKLREPWSRTQLLSEIYGSAFAKMYVGIGLTCRDSRFKKDSTGLLGDICSSHLQGFQSYESIR